MNTARSKAPQNNYNFYVYNDKSNVPISPLYEQNSNSTTISVKIDEWDDESSEEKHDKLGPLDSNTTSTLTTPPSVNIDNDDNDDNDNNHHQPFWEKNRGYSITSPSSRNTMNTGISSTVPVPYTGNTNYTITNMSKPSNRLSTPYTTHPNTPTIPNHSPSLSKRTNITNLSRVTSISYNMTNINNKETFKARYNEFSRKWNRMIRREKYKECERLCIKSIDAINPIIKHQNKRYYDRQISGKEINEAKIYRSQLYHLYGVLCYKYLDDIDKALKQYELSLMDEPNNEFAHCNLATLYRRNEHQEFELSEMHYKKAIELNPKNARFHYNYALLLQHPSNSKYEKAEEHYILALKCDPTHIKSHSKLGHLYEIHLNDNKQAKYHYAMAIKLDPNNIQRRLLYALFLSDRGFEFHAAAKEHEQTVTLYLAKIHKSQEEEETIHLVFDAYKDLLLSKGKFFDDPDTFSSFAVTLLWFDRGHDAKDIMKTVRKRFPDNHFARFIMDPYSIGSDNIIGEDDTNDSISEVTDISEPTELHQHQQQHTEIKQSQDHLIETGKIHKNYICLWFTI